VGDLLAIYVEVTTEGVLSLTLRSCLASAESRQAGRPAIIPRGGNLGAPAAIKVWRSAMLGTITPTSTSASPVRPSAEPALLGETPVIGSHALPRLKYKLHYQEGNITRDMKVRVRPSKANADSRMAYIKDPTIPLPLYRTIGKS
jgi:hypothetical protein